MVRFSDYGDVRVLQPELVAGRHEDRVRPIADPSAPAGFTENVYIVNTDGTGLFQVTDGGVDDNPDWGTPPASP